MYIHQKGCRCKHSFSFFFCVCSLYLQVNGVFAVTSLPVQSFGAAFRLRMVLTLDMYGWTCFPLTLFWVSPPSIMCSCIRAHAFVYTCLGICARTCFFFKKRILWKEFLWGIAISQIFFCFHFIIWYAHIFFFHSLSCFNQRCYVGFSSLLMADPSHSTCGICLCVYSSAYSTCLYVHIQGCKHVLSSWF